MPDDYYPLDSQGNPIRVATDNADKSLMRKRQDKRRKQGKHYHPYEIRPIKVKKDPNESKPLLGKEIIPELYPGMNECGLHGNWASSVALVYARSTQWPSVAERILQVLYHAGSLALLAKTRSGKTTVINHILEHCVDERVDVHIFASTVGLDASWIKVVKDLRHRGVGVTTYTSIFHPVTGVNQLNAVFAEFERKKKQKEKEKKTRKSIYEVVQAPKFLAAPNPIADPDLVAPSESKKEEDYETSAPEHWVIIDDMDQEQLRAKCLDNNLKKCRHYKARILISTQHIIHVTPSALTQLSMVCFWKGFSPNYMAKLHDRLAMHAVIDFKQFWLLYSMATKEDHSFLTYYLTDGSFRSGFSMPPLPVEAVFVPPDQADVQVL